MKKFFEEAEIEVIKFSSEDFVTMSGWDADDDTPDNNDAQYI